MREPTKTGMNKEAVFHGLVENALHFLDEAIKDFESDDLQQSLINFATGVELILKARLLLEHWTLILSDPQKADPVKFMKGDFHSVGIKEAIDRIRKIVGLQISSTAETTFLSIWNHRKRLVHFYHPEYVSVSDDSVKEEIAGLELNGWGQIYVLVTKYWHVQFVDYLDRFEAIDTEMMNHKDFLKGKYEGLKNHIEEEINNEIPYETCTLCGHHACRLEGDVFPVYNGYCRVCIGWMRFLEVTCDSCRKVNYFDLNDEERKCKGCDNSFSMEKLIEFYGNDSPGDGRFTDGYCEECYYAYSGHIVVENEYGDYPMYVCLSCYNISDGMDECQRCGANIAGSHPDTGTYGCVECGDALEEKRAEE